MFRSKKVNILLGITIVMGVLFVIFASNNFRREPKSENNLREYRKRSKELEDSIKELQANIHEYKVAIKELKQKRTEIHYRIKRILNESKEIDTTLANGDWDTNIRFLTEFLSKEDSLKE